MSLRFATSSIKFALRRHQRSNYPSKRHEKNYIRMAILLSWLVNDTTTTTSNFSLVAIASKWLLKIIMNSIHSKFMSQNELNFG